MAFTLTQAAQMLNQSLSESGYDFQIDTTSQDTIGAGFKKVEAYPSSMKSCILEKQMVILKTKALSAMFTESDNPTRRFWRDTVDWGGSFQDIFVKLIQDEPGFWASDFCVDEDGKYGNGQYASEQELINALSKNLLGYKKEEVINHIYSDMIGFQIKLSMSDLEYAQVFTPSGYSNFVNVKYANFQASVEAKLMKIAIAEIQKMISDRKVIFKTGLGLNTANDVTTTVETINTVSDGMQNINSLYNYAQVENLTRASDIFLVVTPEFINRIKSRGYANAFNLEQYKIDNRLIVLPAGTALGTDASGREVGAILMDYRAIAIAIRYWEVGKFIVSNTDYVNSFNKIKVIHGHADFYQAVAFVTGEVGNFTDGESSIIGVYSDSPGYGSWNILVNGNTIDKYTPINDISFVSSGVDTSVKLAYYSVPKNSLVEIKGASGAAVGNIYITPYNSATGYQLISNFSALPYNVSMNFYLDGILIFNSAE